MSDDTPSWGIEPVPERLRVLGLLRRLPALGEPLGVAARDRRGRVPRPARPSQFGLALSLPEAIGAIVAAAVVGNVLLGLGGLIGADARVPTMVLLRAPLGRRGSYLPTGLNILQCLGWSVFELIVIATGASALSQQVLGFGGVAFWKILFGVVATALALLGPVGFVRRYVRKFAVWIVIASLLYLSWWSLHGQHPVALWHRPGAHAFWPGLRPGARDRSISWTPLVADYTRFSRTRAAGFWSAGLGYFVPTIPLFALGAVIAMSRHISDAPSLLTAVAAGGAASVLALLALTVDESDEAFANVYSGAVSLQNLLPRVPQRVLVGGGRGGRDDRRAGRSTCGTTSRSSTCSARSSSRSSPCCSPTGCSPAAATTATTSSRRPSCGSRWSLAWLAGFGLYQWLYPAGPALVDAARRPRASARAAVGRRVAAELRRRLRARGARPRAGAGGPYSRARDRASRKPLAATSSPTGRRATGGGPYHGARALQRLRVPARIVTRCAADGPRRAPAAARSPRHAGALRPRAARPRLLVHRYDGDERRDDASRRSATRGRRPTSPSCRRASAGCTSLRSRVPTSRRDRSRLSPAATASRSTAQGLVRVPEVGPLQLDANFDRDVLRHDLGAEARRRGGRGARRPGRARRREVVADPRLARVDGLHRRHGARTSPRIRSPPIRPAPETRSRPPTSSRATRASPRPVRPVARRPWWRRCSRDDRASSPPSHGAFAVDLETGEVEPCGRRRRAAAPSRSSTCRGVVAAAAAGSTVVAVVDAKPPLLVSHDAGATWRDSGRGLPAGRAVAISADDPDLIVYAARNRLYRLAERRTLLERARRASCRRSRACRAQGRLNSPRATTTAEPPTVDALERVAVAVGLREERRGPVDLGALRDLDLLAEGDPAVAGEVHRERAGRRAGRRRPRRRRASGREHARLPAGAVAGEAIHAVRASRARAPPKSGESAATAPASRARRRDEPGPRSYRSTGSPERSTPTAARIASTFGDRLPRGERLLHPAEDDPRPFALELDRHDAGARLEPDHDLRQRPAEHERAAERRVPRERQLARRGEDADPHVRVLGRRAAGRRPTRRSSSRARAPASSRSSRSRPSVKTASWFPARGVSVKTSRRRSGSGASSTRYRPAPGSPAPVGLRQFGVIVPNKPSFSPFGPAVKNSVPVGPAAAPFPNWSAQSPSIDTGSPLESRSGPCGR